MHVRLIGRPAIFDDAGEARPIRGQQVWAVLTRVLLSRRPLDRRTLAGDLFPDADDPMAALRWCLASLRRALDAAGALTGDPIQPELPDGTTVDVLDLLAGTDTETAYVGELLAGVEPRCSAQFSTWLLVERARVAGMVDERLRSCALQALATRDFERATGHAQAAAARNPFDEGAHVLLVKCLVEGGQRGVAAAHVQDTEQRFMAELGERPSPALRAALAPPPRSTDATPGAASVRSMLEAGRAAVQAGIADSGVELLRRAVADAEPLDDPHLTAEVLLELGAALVHSVRGHDDEGACVLEQALDLARRTGDEAIASTTLCELGYIDAMAGRRPSAARFLGSALEAGLSVGKIARIHGVNGFNLFDWGRFEEGLEHYRLALSAAEKEQDWRTEIWILGVAGWGLIAAGQHDLALEWLDRCLALIERSNWLAFRPFPVALKCEAGLNLGMAPSTFQADLEQAFALSCQMRDPCWEAAVARAMGLCSIASDDLAQAADWLAVAQKHCTRETDTFAALLVQIMMDRADLSRRMGQSSQAEWTTREVLALAARTHADHQLERAIGWLKF